MSPTKRRVLLALVDQGLSSIGNLMFGVIAARSLDVRSFGAFGVAYATYILVLGAVRGLTSDALVVRWSAEEDGERRRASRASLGSALLLSLPIAALSLVVAPFVGGVTGAALLALGVALPALMVQDAVRFVFLTVARPGLAVIDDLIWVGGMVVVALVGVHGVESLILAWGGVNAVAALAALPWCGVPDLTVSRWWWKVSGDLGGRFVIDILAANSAIQLTSYAVAGFAGLTQAAGFRGAQVLLGPLALLFVGGQYALIPEGVRAGATDPSATQRLLRPLTLGLVGIASVYALFVILLPPSAMRLVLDRRSATATQPVVVPMALAFVAASVHASTGTVLRVLQDARRALAGRFVVLPLSLIGGIGGAAVDGARGAAIGLLVASVGGAIVMLAQARASLLEAARATASAPSG